MQKISGFTQIQNEIIFNRALTDGAFRTYVALKSYQYGIKGKSFPSQKTVAQRLGKHRATINAHVRELKDKIGFKVRKRGYSISNEYCFNCQKNTTLDESNSNKIATSIDNNSLPQLKQKPDTNNKTNNTETNNIFYEKERSSGMQKIASVLAEKGINSKRIKKYL